MNNSSLFTNVFKTLFGTQITPTSQQFVPITGSDGTPAGISSMENLKSVLGGFLYINPYTFSYDLDNIPGDRYSYSNNSSSLVHAPFNNGNAWVCVSFALPGDVLKLILFDIEAGKGYTRYNKGNWMPMNP